MKWVFYVIVFVYMCYRAVYGRNMENTLSAEIVNLGANGFFNVRDDITISCKASNKNAKVEWMDPTGEVVSRVTSNRKFVQDHLRGRSPALVLTITGAEVEDSGVYTCQSEDLMKNISLCVIDPVEFVDPETTVTVDLGRSMTLICPAKGAPLPRFSWRKNSEPITDEDTSSKYRVMTQYALEGVQGLLTLISLEPEDSGLYTCETFQGSPQDDDCGYANTLNITLNVRYAPIIEDNDKLVYAQNNRVVELKCSANAYPAPTYIWYKEEKDVSHKLEGKLEFSDGKNESVLVVNPGNSFGQKFRCEATNKLGKADKYFTLAKIEEPMKPTKVTYKNATDNAIEFDVGWDGDTLLPVDSFEIQYIQSSKKPKELAWRKSKQSEFILEEELSELQGVVVTLEHLEEETDYWVRFRAVNSAGESAWSVPVSGSTVAKVEETSTEEPAEDSSTVEEQQGVNDDNYYGIFFAGGILVVAFVCMFAMRMVK